MHFPDLSPYSFLVPKALPDVLNVGWLDSTHEFERGVVPPTFGDHLKRCAVTASANRTRGYHDCPLCPTRTTRPSLVNGSTVFLLGSAEIWLPAEGDRIFAAPNLIVHYVESHGYRPPDAFVSVVMNPSLLKGWDAERICEDRTTEAFR